MKLILNQEKRLDAYNYIIALLLRNKNTVINCNHGVLMFLCYSLIIFLV